MGRPLGWRIVWRVTTEEAGNQVFEIAEVWAVGARADAEVYAEMSDRITALGRHPTAQALSEVIERLGRAAGGVTASTEPVSDPVPPWLVDRLVHQVHMRQDAVAELTGAEAMQAWEAFITGR
jgi:mRNA interferase RelE/StbE